MNASTHGGAPTSLGDARAPRRRPTPVLTVNRKVTLSASFVVVLGFLLVAAISIERQKSSLYDLSRHSLLASTELLAGNIAGGLRWNRPEAVEAAYLEFVMHEGSSIATIMTFDREGELVTRFDSDTLEDYDLQDAPTLSGGAPDGVYLAVEDGYIVVVHPVGLDDAGNRLGTLAVAWSTGTLDAAVTAARRDLLLVSMASLVIIVGVVAVLMSRMVGRPLASMTEVMGVLATGDHKVDVPGTEKRDDIGNIARAVNVFKENAMEVERLRKGQLEAEVRANEERRQAIAGLADSIETKVRSFVESINAAVSEMRETAKSMSSVAELANQYIL